MSPVAFDVAWGPRHSLIQDKGRRLPLTIIVKAQHLKPLAPIHMFAQIS